MKNELTASVLSLLAVFPLRLLAFVVIPPKTGIDLLLVLAIAAGYVGGWLYGVPAAFFIGLLDDFFIGRGLGIRSFSLAVGSMVSASSKEYLTADVIIPRALLAGVASLISDLSAAGLLYVTGRAPGLKYLLGSIAGPGVLWAFVLTLPLTYLLSFASRLLGKAFPGQGVDS